jgi:hypothetical protein
VSTMPAPDGKNGVVPTLRNVPGLITSAADNAAYAGAAGATGKSGSLTKGVENFAKFETENLPRLYERLSSLFDVQFNLERLKKTAGAVWSEAEETDLLNRFEKGKDHFLQEYGHIARESPEAAERILDNCFYSLHLEKRSSKLFGEVEKIAIEGKDKFSETINTLRRFIDPGTLIQNGMDSRQAAKSLTTAHLTDIPRARQTAPSKSYYYSGGGSAYTNVGEASGSSNAVASWIGNIKSTFVQNLSEGPHGKLMMRQTVCYMGGAMALASAAALIANQMASPKSEAEREQLHSYARHYAVSTAAGVAVLLAGGLVGRNF